MANYLGWDTGSLSRYLNGTWRLSSEYADALEDFLDLDGVAAVAVSRMTRRER